MIRPYKTTLCYGLICCLWTMAPKAAPKQAAEGHELCREAVDAVKSAICKLKRNKSWPTLEEEVSPFKGVAPFQEGFLFRDLKEDLMVASSLADIDWEGSASNCQSLEELENSIRFWYPAEEKPRLPILTSLVDNASKRQKGSEHTLHALEGLMRPLSDLRPSNGPSSSFSPSWPCETLESTRPLRASLPPNGRHDSLNGRIWL